jgi:hypothetical protein
LDHPYLPQEKKVLNTPFSIPDNWTFTRFSICRFCPFRAKNGGLCGQDYTASDAFSGIDTTFMVFICPDKTGSVTKHSANWRQDWN